MSLSGDTVKRENLSLGGAGILSDLAIARGEYLALKITFPTQAAVIEIELAPVRWVKPGSFGVEFIRIAPGSPQRLQDYLGRRRLRRRLTHAAYRRLASTPLIGRLSGARLTARKHSAV